MYTSRCQLFKKQKGVYPGNRRAIARICMAKILIISPEKCTNCRSCELACSFSKTGSFNPKEAAVNVLFYEEASISVPVMCMQCEDPACEKVCPVGAFSRDKNGALIVDHKKCMVCKLCVSACPMGNIFVSEGSKKIVKCTLCGGNPYCVKVCPSGAIQYEDVNTSNMKKKKVIAEKFKDLFAEVQK